MKKNVLIVAYSNHPQWELFEKAILSKGLQLLRVSSTKEAFYRLANEYFSIVIFEDDAQGDRQREFSKGLENLPMAQTTPFVVIGSPPQSVERVLLTSLLDQYFPIQIDPDLLAEYIAETYEIRKQKAKRGQLGTIMFPQILFQLSRLHMTGAVVLERLEEKCVVYLESGHIIFASSNRDENRFGEFLVGKGIIQRHELNRAVELMKSTRKRLGKIFVEEGYIKPQVLQTLLQLQIKHITFSSFPWVSGEFYILPDEQCEIDNTVARVDASQLILEGVRLCLNESDLSAFYQIQNGARVSLAQPISEISKRIHLGKDEHDFLKLIGQGRPFNELLSLNSYSRLESLKLLYAFKILCLIVFERRSSPDSFAKELSRDEKQRVLGELFQPERRSVPHHPPPTSHPESKPKTVRFSFVVGAGAMAVAMSIFMVLVTVFDTRTSEVGETAEPRRIQVHNLVIETGNLKVVNIPETSKPEAIQPPAVAAIPVNPPAVEEKKVEDHTTEIKELLGKAKENMKEGRMHDALSNYQKIVVLNPNHVESLLAMGGIYFDLDRAQESIEMLERVKKADPDNPKPYLTIGTIYMMRNQKQKAKESFEKYLTLVKPNSETRLTITDVKRTLQNLESHP